MFSRENWVGLLLLGVCAVVAIALLIEIFTDTTFDYTGPGWIATGISLAGIALIAIMSWRAWGNRLRRWRGGGSGNWPHDDVRGRQTGWPRRNGSSEAPADTTTAPPSTTSSEQRDQPTR